MSEVIGGAIRARASMGAPAVAKAQSVAATIIAIACLSLTACGPQSGPASNSASRASSSQALSPSSGNSQVGSAQGSVPDACGILTQSRASTITGGDTNVQEQLSAPTMGFSDAAIGTSCRWRDDPAPGHAGNAVTLLIVRDTNNADIVGALKNDLNGTTRDANDLAVSGLGDRAFKLVVNNENPALVSVAFVKGDAVALIIVGSTKRSADAIEPEEEIILRQVADRL